MKLRLDISYSINKKYNTSSEYINPILSIDSSILMKSISYAVIDGKRYNRPDTTDCKEINMFYHFILHRKRKISEIKTKDNKHMFLKDGKYHSYDKYCYKSDYSILFAKDGEILTPIEVRSFTIKKIMKKISQNR